MEAREFMKKELKELKLEDFANLFGTTINDIPEDTRDLIAEYELKYRRFSNEERSQIILKILKKIDSEELHVAGKEKKVNWEKNWQENLEEFINSNYDLVKLVPKYFRPNQIFRIYRDYAQPQDSMFSIKWFNIFRSWFFQKYLKDVDAIYEFGCGSGYNLAVLAKFFPDKELYGLEWVNSAVNTVNLIAEKYNYNLKGQLFDIFLPDENLNFSNNSAVFTIGALEQIGSDFENFLEFLLRKNPSLCLNVEPIYELYDKDNLVDYLAMKFHKKRKYLNGYLTYLKQIEKENKIEILKVQRVLYGNCRYQDGHSYVIWRPKKV